MVRDISFAIPVDAAAAAAAHAFLVLSLPTLAYSLNALPPIQFHSGWGDQLAAAGAVGRRCCCIGGASSGGGGSGSKSAKIITHTLGLAFAAVTGTSSNCTRTHERTQFMHSL